MIEKNRLYNLKQKVLNVSFLLNGELYNVRFLGKSPTQVPTVHFFQSSATN